MIEYFVKELRPKNVLELGTGQGFSGAKIMAELPPNSLFTTINYDYPANQVFGECLRPWLNDPRLKMLSADTLDPATVALVTPGVDLLFIDTHHESWVAATELRLFQRMLIHGATVLVDDLQCLELELFWDSIPYAKHIIPGSPVQGWFKYDATRLYTGAFPRGLTPKETADGYIP